MSVGAHYQQVRLDLFGEAHNLLPRIGPVSHGELCLDALGLETRQNIVKIFDAGLDFGRGSERAVDLASDSLFDVQEIDPGSVGARQGSGMGHGAAVALCMVERHQDGSVTEEPGACSRRCG
jgi:hypothetical protein